jgi:hypothetical protein
MLIKGLLTAVAKGLGACVLGGVMLWPITEQAGPQTSEVIVHVTEWPAVVTIDGRSYPVRSWWDTPIVCELRRGRHELRMWRGDRLVYQEAFQVRPGDNIIRTAWAPRRR